MGKQHFYYSIFGLLILFSCRAAESTEVPEESAEPIVPVTVVSVSSGPMEETVELNATSAYLQRWVIKSNVTGYLQGGSLQLNTKVGRGQVLFTVKTKEAAAIGNTINKLDPSFHFNGVNQIRSLGAGFVSELNHQPGDYVQDGEQLGVITDTRSFGFVMDLPYEMRGYLGNPNALQLLLPDGEILEGQISGTLPSMDSASQTQRIVLKVKATHEIPENLIARVKLVKKFSGNAYFLPRAAILSDETQTSFWVMKLFNDSTAVKIEIKKGIETQENIQVKEPLFSGNDKILLTGNFGLNDTARVKIISPSASE